MELRLNSISKFLNSIMIAIFVFLIGLGLFMGTSQGGDYLVALVYGVLFFGAYYLIKPYIISFAKRFGETKSFISLTIICFAVKFLWIFLVRVTPVSDYATFFKYAENLANNWEANSRYVALFPHIFGYSSFLSVFFKIFAPKYYIATGINVLLSVMSGMMLFCIAKRLISLQAAVSTFLFWIMCPSQTVYNSLVLSEPLYTTLIIMFVFIITEINAKGYKSGKKTILKMSLIGMLSGILLRAINVCRPIAVIFIIALVIWIFVLRTSQLQNVSFRHIWIPFLSFVCLVYFLTGPLWNLYISDRLGERPASAPGYNIYVGFNTKTSGTWNRTDAELLFYYSDQPDATAEWAQEQMLDEAKERIFSGDINFTKLFKNKMKFFWGSDDSCVSYVSKYLEDPKSLSIICNSFHYMLLLQCLVGCVGIFHKHRSSTVSILILYVIGLTIAQMLVEVAGRYHYSMIPILLLLGQFVLCEDRKIELFRN